MPFEDTTDQSSVSLDGQLHLNVVETYTGDDGVEDVNEDLIIGFRLLVQRGPGNNLVEPSFRGTTTSFEANVADAVDRIIGSYTAQVREVLAELRDGLTVQKVELERLGQALGLGSATS